MIVNNFKSFPKTGKLLGIDWGEKRIGLAISSPDQKFVFTRDSRSGIRDPEFVNFIQDEDIVGIVLGLPLRLDGTESKTTARVREFAKDLQNKTDVPIILFDESLTSFEASSLSLRGARRATRQSRNDTLDSKSAQVLLENAISFISRL